METIRYVQAADLHLDTPFSGLAKLAPHIAHQLRNATFAALEELTRFCIAEKPDFLVLCGDLYNAENYSIKAQMQLLAACRTLNQHGIPVLVVHGNHDPLSSRFSAINWPPNTHFFGSMPQTIPIEKDGALRALVHGISHEKAPESRNLASLLKRDEKADCFQLGIVHCDVDGNASATLSDLEASGLDALALGHVHTRKILSADPFIAFSGNTQGLHHAETGPRGCFLVTCGNEDGHWQCSAQFHPLGPVLWETIAIELDGCSTMDALENMIAEALPTRGQGEMTILDLHLTGRTPLHGRLNHPEAEEDLTAHIQSMAPDSIFIRKIFLSLAPPISDEDNLDRDDLLGEIARYSRTLQNDPLRLHEIMETATSSLRKNSRGLLPPLQPEMEAQMLESAKRICQDLLEDR